MKWGDILFLAPLSVCPSVRPSPQMDICWVFLLFKTTQQVKNYPIKNGMNGKFSQMDICWVF